MAAPSILVLDNYDSFTFTLVDYLRSLDAEVDVVRADALSVEQAMARGDDGILVSPGPGTPQDAGISVSLAAAAVDDRRPYLGICLGHQALALACGSKVDRVAPVHGKVARVCHDQSGVFEGLPSPLDATRYHSLAVPEPYSPLRPNAWSDDGLVMAMRHEHAPAHGIQFHPESVASEHGHAMLSAFLRICDSKTT
ncbi:anthranilate synthase component II [Sphingomicrobium clamense]|uniref:Aminodeoxychorismate/anthranilate synthase component II n=1 Tax=Sphingomicrobium clamense TaxID=2851013 RepID=A0ABS6V5W4_9SPHN|nr:aminodeoxychorismate/anthranilate synthase component II [Sphingomicrobium sp. B8]MBW0144943.1 aminodeoxychorismate/anthranilate synthase component II [Sphingomicrobium sp. B8]